MRFINIPLKLVYLIFALLYIQGRVFSQSPVLLRSTLGTGGASTIVSAEGHKISFPQSIGQSGITGVYTMKNLELRQGFIQPVLRVKSLNESQNNIISIYPNPLTSVVFVKVNSEITGNIGLNIFDLSGRKVYTDTIPAKEIIQLNLSSLPGGTYILKLTGSNIQANYKLIKY